MGPVEEKQGGSTEGTLGCSNSVNNLDSSRSSTDNFLEQSKKYGLMILP